MLALLREKGYKKVSLAVQKANYAVRMYEKAGFEIADENDEYACFSGMWWVERNKLAYMEPLCTIPEYRHRGLAAAALSRHVQRLRPLGAERMTGGGNPFIRRSDIPMRCTGRSGRSDDDSTKHDLTP